jgi:hypothetical protein
VVLSSVDHEPGSMTKFALVLIETDASRAGARSDRTAHRRSIQEWLEVQAVAGTVVGVETFETEDVGPVTVRRVDPDLVVVLQGPFAGSEETLGGVVLVDVPAATTPSTWPRAGRPGRPSRCARS